MMSSSSYKLGRSPIILVYIVILTAWLSGCLGSGNELARTSWTLTSMAGGELLLGTAIGIEFSRETVLGSAGCNTYTGMYETQDGALLISKTSATRMACTRDDDSLFQGLMDQEKRYLLILERVVRYETIDDSILVMYDDVGNAVLIFERQTIVSQPTVEVTPAESTVAQVREQLAPIEQIEIQTSASSPSQYLLRVISGLPNLCTQFDRFQVIRDGDTIRVSIINVERIASDCEQTYATLEQSIPLGGDFEPGQTYTVQVNDAVETFMARALAPSPPSVEATSPAPTPEALPSPTPESIAADSTAPEPTPTARGDLPACARPPGWAEYVVVEDDNLFRIALRSGTTFEELAEVNCLQNSRQIIVGQTIYVPIPLVDNVPTAGGTFRSFYLILPGDEGNAGPAAGCADSLVAFDSAQQLSGSTLDDVQASLEALLAADPATYRDFGYVDALAGAGLVVQNVNIVDDTIWIHLTGTLPLSGVCADARIRSQILFTVFQYGGFDKAMILINGQNMKQIFDYSGTVAEDEPFLRSEVGQ